MSELDENQSKPEDASALPEAPGTSAPPAESSDPVVTEEEPATVADAPDETPAESAPAESAVARPAGRHAAGDGGKLKPAEGSDFGWYILHTLSGNEEKVKHTMVTTLTREGLADCMADVLIPVEDVVEVKRGKKHIKKRKLFPGYVFVRMKATEPVLKQIRRLPNLARFVGGIGGSGPVPVTDAEISRIRVFMTETKERPKIIYEVGETVRIINGPFMDFNGTILEMDVDRGRLKIQVEIFGRATPVDLDFDQVEKV